MDAGSGLLLLAVLIGSVALAIGAREHLRRRRLIRRRTGRLATLAAEERSVASKVSVTDADTQTTTVAQFFARRYPLSGGVRAGLIAGGAGLATAVALAPALIFLGLAAALAVGLAVALGGATGWGLGLAREEHKRRGYAERFLITIEDFERMTRAGVAPDNALGSVAERSEEPVRSSLRQINLAVDFGVPVADAMTREAYRIRVSDLAMLAAILSTQAQTGGRLSEAVGNVAAMLRSRLDSQAKMRSEIAEPKLSLMILGLVPFAAVGIQASSQPDLFDTLLGQGRHLLAIGIGLIIAGYVVAWLLTRSAQR